MKKGLMGNVMALITMLSVFGLFLAVLSQFDGDLGAMFKWVLSTAWSFVITVRDTIAGWDTFRGLFSK